MLTIEFCVIEAKKKSLLQPLDERFVSFIGSSETVDAIFNAIKFTEPLCKNILSANKLITISENSFKMLEKKKVMIAGDSLSLALSFFLIQEKLLLYNLNHYRKSIFATGAIRKEKKYFLDEVGNIDAKTKNINTQLYDLIALPITNLQQVKPVLRNNFTSIGKNITIDKVVDLILK